MGDDERLDALPDDLEDLAPTDDDEPEERDEEDVEDEGEDDEEADFEEASAGPEAPWSPLPTWLARTFQQANPDAAVDLIFPAVYEEDRSVLLKDLITSQEARFVTHRRAAELAAKELGVENYDYNEEQDAIRAEQKAGVRPPQLGAGDGLAALLGQPPAGPTEPRRRDDLAAPKRDQVSGPVQAELRRDMRQAESARAVFEQLRRELREFRESRGRAAEESGALAALAGELRQLREVLAARDGDERGAVLAQLSEALARVVERVGPAAVTVNPPAVTVQPAAITVEGARVEVPAQPAPVVNVKVAPSPAPAVQVDVHAPEPRATRFERDPAGRIVRSVPEEPA